MASIDRAINQIERIHGVAGDSGGGGGDAGMVATNTTSNATPTVLFLDGSSTLPLIPEGATVLADVRIAAREENGSNSAFFQRRALLSNNGGTTALIGGVQTIGTDMGSNGGDPPAGWAVALSADDTNDALEIEVTGEAATNIQWSAKIDYAEVEY